MIRFFYAWNLPEGIRIPPADKALYRLTTAIQQRLVCRYDPSRLSLHTGAPRAETLTVSLTSFPARIQQVHLTIATLFRQTLRPDRIVLWLAEDEFPDRTLPDSLLRLQERGLEIRFCPNWYSHKKYVGALREQRPDELVVTADDDIIYPENTLELLYHKHRQFPGCIVCNRGKTLKVTAGGGIAPYAQWKLLGPGRHSHPSLFTVPIGCGGVLYPYGALNERVLDTETAMHLARTADDLWLKAMSLKNGTAVVTTRRFCRPYSVVAGTQGVALAHGNTGAQGMNDRVMQALRDWDPEIFRSVCP